MMVMSAASARAVSNDDMTDLRHEEMVITLLKHCHSMKRQETHLRLATGFVVLMGFVVIFFLHYQRHGGATPEAGVGQQIDSFAQAQRDPCPKPSQDPIPSPATTFALTYLPGPRPTTLLHWRAKGNPSLWNITDLHIETAGLYYVYLAMLYRIPAGKCENVQYPIARVTLLSERYPEQTKMISKDMMNCSNMYPNHKTVYMGQILDLKKGDKLKVEVTTPELIDYYSDAREGIQFGGLSLQGMTQSN